MSMEQYLDQTMNDAACEAIDLELGLENTRLESVSMSMRELHGRVSEACARVGQDLSTVLLAGYLAMLAKLTGASTFAVLVRGPHEEPSPLRVTVDRRLTFSQFVAYVSQAGRCGSESCCNDDATSAVALSNFPVFWEGGGCKASWSQNLSLQIDSRAQLLCSAWIGTGRVYVLLEIARAYCHLLEMAILNWDARLESLPLVGGRDRYRLLQEFNDTDTHFDSRTIQEIFEEAVERGPGQMAVHDGSLSLTYAELNRLANRLAHRLRRMGVDRNTICGIFVPRSVHWCIALLGILKAGGAFLTFDAGHPAERLRFMLQDSGCKLVVGFEPLPGANEADLVDPRDKSLEDEPDTNPENRNEVTDIAYVIYTSGTTGTPKGVLLCHEGIASFDQHYKQSFGFAREERILNFFSPSFDGSISEMTMALLAGTSFYILPNRVKESYRHFEQYLNEHRITVATIPPPYLSYLDPEAFPYLHTIFVAGSASSAKLMERWNEKKSIVNHYGPTEVTICATEWKAPRGRSISTVVPIGYPIANKKVYILNQDGDLQPIGIRGQLCVSGIRLSPGYLNQPELSADKFVVNPLAQELPFTQRERHSNYYRTGDCGRWLPDGSIEYLGRIDNQVKIRGFRVEIGEIEQILQSADGVTDAAVIAKADDSGESTLYGFFSGSAIAEDVREHIASRVPDYMVPTRLVHVESMPLTRHDKVDNRRLEAMLVDSWNTTSAEPPLEDIDEDPLETTVFRLIAESSGGSVSAAHVHRKDNLDSLGISSLRFFKLMLKIEEQFGLEFDDDFFIGRKELTAGAVVQETRSRLARPETAQMS
jgi:amino acid adenylation domain-containing protein